MRHLLVIAFTSLAIGINAFASSRAGSTPLHHCHAVQLDWVKKNAKSLDPVDVVNATLATDAFPNVFKVLLDTEANKIQQTALLQYLREICPPGQNSKSLICSTLEKLEFNSKIEARLFESSMNQQVGELDLLSGAYDPGIDGLEAKELVQYLTNKIDIQRNAGAISRSILGGGAYPCAETTVLFPIHLIGGQSKGELSLRLLTIFRFTDLNKIPIGLRSQLLLIQQQLLHAARTQISTLYPVLIGLAKNTEADFSVGPLLVASPKIAEEFLSAYQADPKVSVSAFLKRALRMVTDNSPAPSAEASAAKAVIALTLLEELMGQTPNQTLSYEPSSSLELVYGKQELRALESQIEAEVAMLAESLTQYFAEVKLN